MCISDNINHVTLQYSQENSFAFSLWYLGLRRLALEVTNFITTITTTTVMYFLNFVSNWTSGCDVASEKIGLQGKRPVRAQIKMFL